MANFKKYHTGAVRTTIWMPTDLRARVSAAAVSDGVSQTEWIQRALRAQLPAAPAKAPRPIRQKPTAFG